MSKITILPETTKDPISLMGRRAGVCWGADIADAKKNYKRGLDCIKSNHGRVMEFVNIEAVIDGYSARVIREWYTHLGGAPTRLQASTRYIDYGNDFDFIFPDSIQSIEQKNIYVGAMATVADAARDLEKLGVPREDSALVLPLGMTTKIVDKRNVRNVMDMSRQRLCTRAYWEYRELLKEYLNQLANYSEEWATLIPMIMMPKCEMLGYCPETKGCGKYPKKDSGD